MFKKILLIGLLIAFTSMAGFSYAEDVVVTANGAKYHKSTCNLIKNKENIKTMDKKVAQEAGYEPCKRCYKEDVADDLDDNSALKEE